MRYGKKYEMDLTYNNRESQGFIYWQKTEFILKIASDCDTVQNEI